MTEIENNESNKVTEVAPVTQEITKNTITEPEEIGPEIKSSENKKNWEQFREAKKRERQEKEEALKLAAQKQAEAEALKAAMEALLNKQSNYPQNQQDHYSEESEEQIIDKKVKEALERERHRIKEEQATHEAQTYPTRLLDTYKDFNYVCTEEACDYLDYHHPEITTALKYMPDGFERWSTIYKAIKKYVPHMDKKDQQRIEKNLTKPQANMPQLTDTNPQTSGWRLTEERKKENWRRMQQDRKSFK